ncbi:MAG: primosomal protein N', partial [Phycisphaerales bacterium]|nr:primosomal protein N' [Phycisphaerales bacterium]
MPDLFEPDAPPVSYQRYVRVVVERGIERVGLESDSYVPPEHALTYGMPGETPVEPGQRVVVPLGRGNKPAAGIVTVVGGPELLDGLEPRKVKPVAKVTPVRLAPTLVRLGAWMGEYYISPLGMVYATMLPAAVKRDTGRKSQTYLEPAPAEARAALGELPGRLKKVWEQIESVDADLWPLTPKALKRWAEGLGATSLKKLVETGWLIATVRDEVTPVTDPFEGLSHTPAAAKPQPKLTPEQAAAYESVKTSLHAGVFGAGEFRVHLLHGVTGSGKTEVYLRAIEEMLLRKGPGGEVNADGAIMLVPEIALTPQTAQRFIDRFGPKVAVLHSGLTASQRHAQWASCASGAVRVVVGARSAVFAPFNKVGLIIVDEEHDSSYKQDQLPRYHGRDVAIKRAQLERCPVILGSATPSLESWHATTPAGGSKYLLSSLPNRVVGGRLPPVRIVDLAEERRLRALVHPEGWRDRHVHLLGPSLEQALGETLSAGGQAILLLNRRGYANYICCTDPKCGWFMQCDHCDVTTVYHLDKRLRTGGYVRCHHCLAELQLPKACPKCTKAVNTFGLGTQRVEAELERKFGPSHGLSMGHTLLRLDSDTMQSARDYFSALSRFASGEVKVLVGTQMIAKGLDFPNVRLVGVVSADTSLTLPDFRAAERTFQLVAQVAGRAGRGEMGGQVIVQTFNPAEPSIVTVCPGGASSPAAARNRVAV